MWRGVGDSSRAGEVGDEEGAVLCGRIGANRCVDRGAGRGCAEWLVDLAAVLHAQLATVVIKGVKPEAQVRGAGHFRSDLVAGVFEFDLVLF